MTLTEETINLATIKIYNISKKTNNSIRMTNLEDKLLIAVYNKVVSIMIPLLLSHIQEQITSTITILKISTMTIIHKGKMDIKIM